MEWESELDSIQRPGAENARDGQKKMSQKEMMAEPTVLNVTELLARVENDRELLRDLVRIFKDDLPVQLASLREAIQAEQMQCIATAGHTLKGMLSNLAASRAAMAAGHLEHLGREGEKEGMGEAFAKLEKAISLLLPELELCATEIST
jgi:two-component system, sensor histidine kinase and response regulator